MNQPSTPTSRRKKAQDAVLKMVSLKDCHPYQFSKLLSGVDMLKRPKWDAMRPDERLLHACLIAYVKHHMGIDIVGWNEFGNLLCNALCEAVGDEDFQKWTRMIADAENIET